MNEYETDPRRPSANAEPTNPIDESTRAERGSADSSGSMPQPTEAESMPRPADPGPTAPPADGSPLASVEPPTGTEPPASAPSGPASAPPAGVSGPASAPPVVPGGYPPSAWQPAHHRPVTHHNQPGWAGNPSAYQGHYPGSPGPVPFSGPADPRGGPPPMWSPHGPVVSGRVPGPSRLGRVLAAAAAALVLMAGSGIAGGVVALAIDGNLGSGGRTYTAAPIIDSADLPKIAAAVENSVVSISTGSGEGSGVVLTADGYVLTNNHVVASGSGDRVRVIFANGKNATAKIVGTDAKTDLAVLKADGVSGLSPAKFGDSDAMQVGDTVLALGSPLGLQGSVTAGIISARERTIRAGDQSDELEQQRGATSISGLLQTDAPINPGNSGGALINTRGEVIGINTAIATAGQGTGNIGLGFAIPSNKAKAVAETLRGGGKVSHPSLGVSVGDAEQGGALVSTVVPNSPAAQVGMQQGDVVVSYGGKAINDANDLVAAVQAGKVGDRVELKFLRNGAEKTATVTLAETS
ncbi:S1C family serine protease [Micromonospora polyrhachis]|uniref:Putative serine protease PepD n=1 Tax=Micromonospora polyrhachis TaxID=1282883 RepID=A0A7W7SSR1_9ACTN|nr:trypsin-like peptidase domain-containing protein [Micromonospora polyrhachis]MBB4960156.1 putative serine protease PepD [Micromonospora polyrhachis]